MGAASFGKYRLIAELGHGGMADVFLAVQAGPTGSGFRKLTVIKRLRQNLAEEPEFIAMLVDEARITSRLNHPNVVQTNEVGQVGPQYFLAMEYLDGQPLHRIQQRTEQRRAKGATPPVTQEQLYIVLLDTLAGLHHAHELCDFDGSPLKIVHRDMTPQNIFVTYAGQVKVVDFGIAKAVGRVAETRQGVVKGKVRYMAPEQAIGRAVDRRADIFAVGVMLWEVATKRRMWKDIDDLQIVQLLVSGKTPGSPRAIEPTVPEALDRICKKALATKPDDRYATADAFRADLEEFLTERGLLAARRALAPAVSELFQDKRTAIKIIIEQQLAALDEHASGEVQIAPRSVTSHSGVSVRIGGASETSTSFPTAPPRGRFARRLAVALSTLALAAAVAVIVLWRVPGARSWTASTPEAVAPAEITLHLSAKPANARVSIDDGPPKGVPADVRLAKDEHDHRVRIEADGYVPRVEVVRFATDTAMSIELHPAAPKNAASASARAPSGVPSVVPGVKNVPPSSKPGDNSAATSTPRP